MPLRAVMKKQSYPFFERSFALAIYGYARVSTPQQSIDRQIRNIKKEYPEVKKIYSEAYTGTTTDREQFRKLRKVLKSGDIVVFDSVSRMSRTAEDGVKIYLDLMRSGVDLVFLKEHHIDTRVFKKAQAEVQLPKVETGHDPTDRLIGSIMDAISDFMKSLIEQQVVQAFEQAEKEVLDLRQRTKEGIETARIAGKTIGRPVGSGHGYTTKKEIEMIPMIEKLSRSFGGVLSDKECMKTLGISQTTYYKYKRKIKQTQTT